MSKAQEAEQMQLDWSNIQYKVSKLQSKIYESSLKGDKKSVGFTKNLLEELAEPKTYFLNTDSSHSFNILSSAFNMNLDNWLTKVVSVFCV